MQKPSKLAQTPQIRFAGFTKPWEIRKFSDTFVFLQNNNLSRAELTDLNGKIINIHYGDILIKYAAILNIKKNDLTYVLDNSIIKKYQSSTLQNGDIIIADAAEDQSVGKCSEITGLTNEIVLSGLHTIPCRPNEKYAKGFLGHYMNSNSYHDQLLPLLQGTKVSSISKSALQNTDIIYPTNQAEQQKIGELFANLDNLITLHQSKFEKLQKIKKSCLQNLFPQNNQNTPKIRFKNFSDEWVERKADEICTIETGKSNTQDQNDNGKYPFYIRSDKPVRSNKFLYDCEAVITIGDGSIGKVFHYVKGKFDLHQRCYKMTDFKDVTGKYFYYYFSTKFYDRAMKMTAKATVDSVRLEMISDMFFSIPNNLAEQCKISEFFTKLDKLITLQQRKVEKLKDIKAAMLSKAFI